MDNPNAALAGRPYVVVAFGNAEHRARVATALMSFYQPEKVSDSPRALTACRTYLPSVVVVGEELPESNGYDFVHMLRLDPALAVVSVVMVVAKDDQATRRAVAKCGAQAFVTQTCSQSTLLAAISNILNRGVERQWQTLPALQKQALTGTLALFNGISTVIGNGEPIPYDTIGDACKPLIAAVANNDFKGILNGVKNHDDYSYAHSVRVATLLALLGFNLRLSKDEQVILASGGLLHDVGKMSIPNAVLNKPGRLTAEEFTVMKGHVNASMAYLKGCPDLPKGVLTIAAQHHEKLDGSGYPFGLPGSKLDELARMASIVDVFSALTDRRVYKAPMEAEAALKLMVDEMSSHLDMKLLSLFRQMLLDATQTVPAVVA